MDRVVQYREKNETKNQFIARGQEARGAGRGWGKRERADGWNWKRARYRNREGAERGGNGMREPGWRGSGIGGAGESCKEQGEQEESWRTAGESINSMFFIAVIIKVVLRM